jgi:hypothetical protein
MILKRLSVRVEYDSQRALTFQNVPYQASVGAQDYCKVYCKRQFLADVLEKF